MSNNRTLADLPSGNNLEITGTITATSFSGDGSNLTNITKSPISKTVSSLSPGISAGDVLILDSTGTVDKIGEPVDVSNLNVYENFINTSGTSFTNSGVNVALNPDDPTQILVTTCDFFSDELRAVIGTISGDTISFGTEVVVASGAAFNDSYDVEFNPFDTTKAMVVYHDNSFVGKAVVLTITGTTISVGTAVTISDTDTTVQYVKVQYSREYANRVYIRYHCDTSVVKVRLWSMTDSTTFGSSLQVASLSSGIATASIGVFQGNPYISTDLIIASTRGAPDTQYYAITTDAGGNAFTVTGGVSGLFGVVSAELPTHLSFDSEDPTKFLITVNFGSTLYVGIGSLSGTTISSGSAYSLLTGTSTSGVAVITKGKKIVGYSNDQSFGEGKIGTASYNGTTITTGSSITSGFLTYNPGAYFDAVTLPSGRAIFVAENGDSGKDGRVGVIFSDYYTSIAGFELTSSRSIIGISSGNYTSGQTATIVGDGGVYVTTGLTEGSSYYADSSTGTYSTTSSAYAVGTATSSTELQVKPYYNGAVSLVSTENTWTADQTMLSGTKLYFDTTLENYIDYDISSMHIQSATSILMINGGNGVSLSHNDSAKLNTSSTGVQVIGSFKPTYYLEAVVNDTTATGTQPLNCAGGNGFTWYLTGNITSVSFSNVPASGTMYSCTIAITQNASTAYTITWPASIKWSGGTAHTMSTTLSSVDIVTLMTVDGGTTWYGFVAGQEFA